MTGDLTAIEKRPKSFRLNLADAKVVYENTEAKGTITEFQKDDSNPSVVKVKSMIKVQVEGYGESDYIPLWFCPQKKYWDTSEGADDAQDFNQDGMYYENAWMSFRGGDEVKVLMQYDDSGNPTPKAVMGFFDNIPLVGENSIKLFIQDFDGGNKRNVYLPLNTGINVSPDPEKGPDGISLNLTKEVLRFTDIAGDYGEESYTPPDPDHTESWISSSVGHGQYIEWLIELGGLAYILQVFNSTLTIVGVTGHFIKFDSVGALYSHTYATGSAYSEMNAAMLVAPNNKELIDNIKAAKPSYNLDALNQQFGSQGYGADYPGFSVSIRSPAFSYSIYPLDPYSDYGTGKGIANGASIKIYQSPHTKEELQAAGLWPWSN